MIQSAPEVVGIVNALIHTRVGLGWAIEAQQSPPPSQMAFAKVGPTPQGTEEGEDTDIRQMSMEFRREGSLDAERASRRSFTGEKNTQGFESSLEAGDAHLPNIVEEKA